MLRHVLRRQHDEPSRPVYLFCDPRLPFKFRQTWLLTNVVDSPSRSIRCRRNRDSMRYVLYIPSWAPPGSEIVGKQYGRSAISNAFQQREESMEGISGPVHHG